MTRSFQLAHSVLDGVFDQRLQDQIGHKGFSNIRRDLLRYAEFVLKAEALDIQVTVEKLKLLAEGHLAGGGFLERIA